MEQYYRQPLKDIGANSPSVKRQKLQTPQHQHQHHHQQQQEHYLQEYSLSDWQKRWRAIMTSSTIYFDSNDISGIQIDASKRKEKEKAVRLFTSVGAQIQPFFDNTVTIVVSRRGRDDLPRNMTHPSIKIWNFDKVFRFFKNLGEIVSDSTESATNHLSAMLNEERLHGTTDRDPSAKRDDYTYLFKHPYFFVYDLRDIMKPVAVREWKIKETRSAESQRPWPHLHESTYGHSLFQPDPNDMMEDRKVRKRRLRDEQNAEYRRKLRQVYSKNPNAYIFNSESVETSPADYDTKSNDNKTNDYEETTNDEISNTSASAANTSKINNNDYIKRAPIMPPPLPQINSNNSYDQQPRPNIPLLRQTSLIQNKYIESTKRDGFEMQASGYNGSTNVSQQSAEFQTRNGLAPIASTASSAQFNNLQRKNILKKRILTTTNATTNTNNANANSTTVTATNTSASNSTASKAKVPGYCENCKTHFEDFDAHIVGSAHRAFARNSSQFHGIDVLIDALRKRVKSKQ